MEVRSQDCNICAGRRAGQGEDKFSSVQEKNWRASSEAAELNTGDEGPQFVAAGGGRPGNLADTSPADKCGLSELLSFWSLIWLTAELGSMSWVFVGADMGGCCGLIGQCSGAVLGLRKGMIKEGVHPTS